MKILKRNQLVILVIALMLITAGYLNYTSDKNNIAVTSLIASNDTTLGDAALVSANVMEDENNVMSSISSENIIENNTIETATTVTDDGYFTNSKLERNSMYSELLETYQELYNNTSASAEEKKEALTKINEINNTKNSIMIAENLISAKGIKDLVVFVNDESVSVVIKSEELRTRTNCTSTKYYF